MLYSLKDSKIFFEFEYIFKSFIYFVNELFHLKEESYLELVTACIAILYKYSCWPQREDDDPKNKNQNEKQESSKISNEEFIVLY